MSTKIGPSSSLMRGLGSFLEIRVLVKTEIYKLRRVALVDGCGRIPPFDLFKFEINRAVGAYGTEQKTVNLGARLLRPWSLWRQGVALSAGGADDPSRQDAAVGFPIIRIE